ETPSDHPSTTTPDRPPQTAPAAPQPSADRTRSRQPNNPTAPTPPSSPGARTPGGTDPPPSYPAPRPSRHRPQLVPLVPRMQDQREQRLKRRRIVMPAEVQPAARNQHHSHIGLRPTTITPVGSIQRARNPRILAHN